MKKPQRWCRTRRHLALPSPPPRHHLLRDPHLVSHRLADDEKRRRRVKAGGNKKVRFVEGWVEFLRRADAKRAAEMLHNRPVISSGRGFHGSDLWSLKYLKHFGWHHLQEKLQYEQKLRAARLRAGLAAARRDNEAYLKRAEAAERIAGVERRKRKRASAEDAGTKGGAAAAAVEVEIRAKRAKAARNLKQTVPLRRPMGEAPPSKTDE